MIALLELTLDLQHIIKLLDDESQEIQASLRNAIFSKSIDFIFKKPYIQNQTPPESRENLDNILQSMHKELVLQAFSQLVRRNLEDIDLQSAVMLLSYWNDPSLNIPDLIYQLDIIAEEIDEDLPHSGHPMVFIDHINSILFKKYHFRGNKTDYYHPDNSYIDRVLKTKRGIPISLSILYILVSKRLNIPISGVPMPAHFILKYEKDSDEIFFDPFYRGKIYNRKECINYLSHANISNINAILDGCSDFDIFLRLLGNLRLVYSSYKEDPDKVDEIEKFANMIDLQYG